MANKTVAHSRKLTFNVSLKALMIAALLLLQWAVNAHACADFARSTQPNVPQHCKQLQSADYHPHAGSICFEHCTKPAKHSESAPAPETTYVPSLVSLVLESTSFSDTHIAFQSLQSRAHSPPILIRYQRFLI